MAQVLQGSGMRIQHAHAQTSCMCAAVMGCKGLIGKCVRHSCLSLKRYSFMHVRHRCNEPL